MNFERVKESLNSETHVLPDGKHSIEELDTIFENVAKREERQPTPSEEERIKHAKYAREIAKQNTDEMLKVNNFNNPQL